MVSRSAPLLVAYLAIQFLSVIQVVLKVVEVVVKIAPKVLRGYAEGT